MFQCHTLHSADKLFHLSFVNQFYFQENETSKVGQRCQEIKWSKLVRGAFCSQMFGSCALAVQSNTGWSNPKVINLTCNKKY